MREEIKITEARDIYGVYGKYTENLAKAILFGSKEDYHIVKEINKEDAYKYGPRDYCKEYKEYTGIDLLNNETIEFNDLSSSFFTKPYIKLSELNYYISCEFRNKEKELEKAEAEVERLKNELTKGMDVYTNLINTINQQLEKYPEDVYEELSNDFETLEELVLKLQERNTQGKLSMAEFEGYKFYSDAVDMDEAHYRVYEMSLDKYKIEKDYLAKKPELIEKYTKVGEKHLTEGQLVIWKEEVENLLSSDYKEELFPSLVSIIERYISFGDTLEDIKTNYFGTHKDMTKRNKTIFTIVEKLLEV